MESQNKQRNKKIIFFPHPWRIFALEVFLFFLTLGLGIVTADKINNNLRLQKVAPPEISLPDFLLYFLLSSLFIFLVSYFLRLQKGKNLIFRTIFILAVFSGGLTFLSAWLPDEISLVLMSFLVFWWLRKPSIFIQNLLIMGAIVGAGSVIGLALEPSMVILLLAIFSVYDFIAVYKTGHMIKMAKEMLKSKAMLALIIPSNISGLKESLEKVKPGGKFLILGGGDIISPLLLAASLVPSSISKSLIVAFFALVGLSFTFLIFLSQKKRQPIPALPPIALFSILGYLVTFFL